MNPGAEVLVTGQLGDRRGFESSVFCFRFGKSSEVLFLLQVFFGGFLLFFLGGFGGKMFFLHS